MNQDGWDTVLHRYDAVWMYISGHFKGWLPLF